MEKESFLFHKVWKDIIGGLPGRVRAEVYEAIIEYGLTGKLPQLKTQARIAFDFVKKDIDRENEEQCRKAVKSEKMRNIAIRRWKQEKDTNAYANAMQTHMQTQCRRNADVNTPNLTCVVDNNKKIEDNIDNIITQSIETEENKEPPKGGKKEKPLQLSEMPCLTPQTLLEKRKMEFYDSLVPFVERYGKGMIRAFYDYWTEPNKSQTKMRYELEKTWDIGRRIARWANNSFNRNANVTDKNNNGNNTKERVSNAAKIVASLLEEDSC